MTSAFEAITAVFKTYIDNEPKPPLHVGEVMDLWTAYTAFQEAQSLYQVGLNTTTNSDLVHILQKALEGSSSDTKNIETLLKNEGIPLPRANPSKPTTKPQAVPEGVKLTDDEISNLVSVKIATAITFCAQAGSKSIRTDVGMLFFSMQLGLIKFALPLKNVMKEHGWLRVPPAFQSAGSPE
ncbi:DUF3231 family protein [Bacillus weihaiensis]|uniref:DUF3231 domain-containing protein n=1 Tax=Bacillus weihaiensis TaxID=1547283 RepID=A0A1L3MTP3_9BACI|nr:DUF3231 family protein [Bacillus weihaiensis]APH05703.1 hypothetical protein A9C19_13625 [Bacillus weihaiensis]